MSRGPLLTAADLSQIEAHGLTRDEVLRQLALFAAPPVPVRLLRPATVGDGVVRIDRERQHGLVARWEEACRAGRLSKFVPASGAASRMFSGLEEADTPEKVRYLANASRFPFTEGLDRLRGLPKGLVPFHRYADGARTPFEEHLVEAAAVARDESSVCRLHVTVSPEHETAFRALLDGPGARLALRLGVRFAVVFSHQEPATDTIATDQDDRPFRLADGTIFFRPGGHGALLPNLESSGGDVVLIKNIDNVQREEQAGPGILCKKLLAGALLEIEGTAREEGRPVRVAGVVLNQGEPGGGPFWVAGPEGPSLQIVESSQVDISDPSQAAIWNASTHFNPVDLAVSLRDRSGRPYRLGEFVDESAVFIARKTKDGRAVKALERPGLWNGAMARWKTLFVEIPVAAFTPVKTVFDLLRPEHQPS